MIICEAACNHLGSFTVAVAMIGAAKEAGADAIKFQMYVTEKINDPSLHDYLEHWRLEEDEHIFLKKTCEQIGIEYMCSAFDIESPDILADMKVGRIKIPSGQIHNKTYLRKAASLGIPLIMSTGMSTITEIEDAVNILGEPAILHCTSAYPVPDEDVNLNSMMSLMKHFPNHEVGFSDHTMNLLAAVIATSMGAKIIERHFTLSRYMVTSDSPASFEPKELKTYIESINKVKTIMGEYGKPVTQSEQPNLHRRDYRKD